MWPFIQHTRFWRDERDGESRSFHDTRISEHVERSHLKSSNSKFDVSSLSISVGSTPSMFSHDNALKIPNIELHPGNYVFYDRQQLWTGACSSEKSIGGFVLSRIIGHYDDEHRNAIMVDAGATALTKESTPQGSMCSVLGRPDLECYRMSQEITMIRCKSEDGVNNFPISGIPAWFNSFVDTQPQLSCCSLL